jgi:hypothetical protein
MDQPQLVVADVGARWCPANLAAHAGFQPEAELGGILAMDDSFKQCLEGVWADVTDDGSGV